MPHMRETVCEKALWLERVWHVEGPENQQRDWRETEVADGWDPESLRAMGNDSVFLRKGFHEHIFIL